MVYIGAMIPLCWASRQSGKPVSLGHNAAARRKSRLSGTGLTEPSLGTDEMSDGSGAPTGPKRPPESNLALQVRKRRVIDGAWLAIKRNARTSKSPDTKNEIVGFEEHVIKNLQYIQKQLQGRKFVFLIWRGIRSPKGKVKDSFPPLVVAPVESRFWRRSVYVLRVSVPAI